MLLPLFHLTTNPLTLLQVFPRTLTVVLTSAIVCSLVIYASYNKGVATEKLRWQKQTTELQVKVDEQTRISNEHSKEITKNYTDELARLRLLNGSPRRDLGGSVRVQQASCTRETIPSEQASGTPEGAPSVSQEEWERVNAARFSENLLQLEALRSWIDNLYRDYFK